MSLFRSVMKIVRLRNKAVAGLVCFTLGVVMVVKLSANSPSDDNNSDGVGPVRKVSDARGAAVFVRAPVQESGAEKFHDDEIKPGIAMKIKVEKSNKHKIHNGNGGEIPVIRVPQDKTFNREDEDVVGGDDRRVGARPVHNNKINNQQDNHNQLQNQQQNQVWSIQNPHFPGRRRPGQDGIGARQDGAGSAQNGTYPNLVRGNFVPTRRIVHFDLKGAAPRVAYFREVFQVIAKLGATGVLLEWEDMFPYTGDLAITKNGNAYSEKDVRSILGFANEAGLDIIPLVQTFGHLEWILKHEKFAHLRQQERYPQVICMGDDEAVNMVKMAIDQVMSIHRHFPMPFFHMGADEAFQIGMCQKDQELMRKLEGSRERLMLRHISNIAHYVKEKYNTRILLWHDMLNNVDAQMINEYKLGEIAEPVVWAYAENLNDYLMPDMWQRFGDMFPYIWGGSAYKGADGPSRYYSNVPHYLQNHISWTQQMTREYKNFKEFRGLILTGWQRFDHFAVLCEILPVGIPSAAVNLQTIVRGQYDRSVLQEASKHLQCSGVLDIDNMGVGAYCNFPGAKIYQAIQQLRLTLANIKQNLYDDYQVQGWLSEFNIRHNYSSAWYLDQIMDKVSMHLSDLEAIAATLRKEMALVFFADTVDEVIYEYVEPDLNRLRQMSKAAKRISERRTFPNRPFPIRGKTSTWTGDSPAAPRQNRKRRAADELATNRENNNAGL